MVVTRKVVFIVRHCQAVGQDPEAPLSKLGEQQARALADHFCKSPIPVQRIIASPYLRVAQSIRLLAERLGLDIEPDERLVERVLSSTPLEDWRERLAETFVDLDLSFEGGESSRSAMRRGIGVVDHAIAHCPTATILVTHGNLMTLILKYFDDRYGYAEWENLQNPDVYSLTFGPEKIDVERIQTIRTKR